MKHIGLSINPTYYCNHNCSYCYLEDLRKDKTLLDLDVLETRLRELKAYVIDYIEIFGGSITHLTYEYMDRLLTLCNQCCDDVCVVNDSTKLLYELQQKHHFHMATSYNQERGYKPIDKYVDAYLCVVLPSLLKCDVKELLNKINKDVYFLQFYPTKNTKDKFVISNREYCEFIIKVMEEYTNNEYPFELLNMRTYDAWYNGEYNPSIDSHLFINPNGNYCVTKYINGYEYFYNFESLSELDNLIKEEEKEFKYNRCILCEHNGHCLAEHLNDWDKNDVCCGLTPIMNWYKEYKNAGRKANIY